MPGPEPRFSTGLLAAALSGGVTSRPDGGARVIPLAQETGVLACRYVAGVALVKTRKINEDASFETWRAVARSG